MKDLLKKIIEQNETLIEQNKVKIQLLKDHQKELSLLNCNSKSLEEHLIERIRSVIINMADNTDIISNNMLSLLSKNDTLGFQTAKGWLPDMQLSRKNGYISYNWDNMLGGVNRLEKKKLSSVQSPNQEPTL